VQFSCKRFEHTRHDPTAVLAARMLGGTRTVHVRIVTLLLAGETAPRRARVRAAAAAAAANSGPIGTMMGQGIGLRLR
jgi:hypothetical protein